MDFNGTEPIYDIVLCYLTPDAAFSYIVLRLTLTTSDACFSNWVEIFQLPHQIASYRKSQKCDNKKVIHKLRVT